jgi:(p)ppGpp synthase/HD superfamily hydrolase
VIEALKFATEKHKGQVRKYTGEEYINHPIAVADIVEGYLDAKGYNQEDIAFAIQVALLHDTVEDTDATMDDIESLFGPEIAKGVWFMTKTPDYVGNRKFRKEMCEARLREAPEVIRILKTADMFHNSQSIEEFDPGFWETFKEETVSLLLAMDCVEVMVELEEVRQMGVISQNNQ